MKIRPAPWPLRTISLLLAITLALQSMFPGYIWAASIVTAHAQKNEFAVAEPSAAQSSSSQIIRPVSLPQRVSVFPHFSSQPSDTEIFEAHVFPTALVPIEKTTLAENRALADALIKYLKRSNPEDQSIILDYLEQNPDSPWKASLLLNLGIVWRQAGYFSEALNAWQEAWDLSEQQTNYRTKALADRAFAEMVQLYAWVGRYSDLQALFAGVTNRAFSGRAQEMVSEAREGLGVMNRDPGAGFMCGPYALRQIIAATDSKADIKTLFAIRSTKEGFSLTELLQLAERVGLKYQMAKRTPGSPIIINSVVHWKLNHYGALLRDQNGRYLVQDSTFSRMYGQELWVSQSVLDKESDGYYLVPAGPLPSGWRSVSESEGQKVWGKGQVGTHDPNACDCNTDKKSCNDCSNPQAMPRYSSFLEMVSLNIVDEPLWYDPPRGPEMNFMVVYNQRDSFYPGAQFSNLGDHWTLGCFGYILEGADGSRGNVWEYVIGGGRMEHMNYNSSTGYYDAARDGSVLQYDATHDIYTLTQPDGSKEFYSQPDTANSSGREMLLTAIEDPQGNTVQIIYDASVAGRIDYVVDALGQTNTLHYDLPSDPYKITSVEAPFPEASGANLVPNGAAYNNTTYTLSGLQTGTRYVVSFGPDDTSLVNGTQTINNPGNTNLILFTAQSASVRLNNDGQLGNPPVGAAVYLASFPTAYFEYDTSGQLSAITDMGGLTSYFQYGVFGSDNLPCISSMITPYGTNTFNCYENGDTGDRWLTMTDPKGATEKVEYSVQGYQSSETQFPSDSFDTGVGYPVAVSGGSTLLDYRNTLYWDKKAYAMSYNGADASKATVYHWMHDYDDSGDVICSRILESIKRPLENRIWFLYPGQQNSAYASGVTLMKPCIVDRLVNNPANPGTEVDQVYQYGYNTQGQITNFIDPLGRQTTFDYNGIDLVDIRQTTGGMNDILAQLGPYNAQHLPAYFTNAALQVWSLGWNSYGQLSSVINPKNETTQLNYDPNGYLQNIERLWSGGTKESSLTYDSFGRVHSVTDSEGYSVTNLYDALNRLTAQIYPNGTSNAYQYLRLDLVSVRDRAGHLTQMGYDNDGRLTSVVDPLGRLTQYVWCPCGELESIIDPLGHATTWTRDLEGRVTDKTYFDSTDVHYTYDPQSGLPNSVTDPRGEIKTYSYNLDDTLASITYSGTTYNNADGNPIVTPAVGLAYDQNYKRVLTVTNGTGSAAFLYSYAYYPVGVLGAGELETVGGPLATITYSYDALNQLTSRAIDGVNETWTYDDLDRMTNNINPLGSFAAAYVDATLRMASLTYPNGQQTVYSYLDNAGDQRLKEIWNQASGGATLSKFDYIYDAVGQITQWTQQSDDNSAREMDLEYDAAGQLINAAMGSAGGTATNGFGYGYDLAANRTSEEMDTFGSSPVSTVTASSYNGVNELNARSGGNGSVPVIFQGKINKPGRVGVAGQVALMTPDPTSTSNAEIFTATVSLPLGGNTVTITATNLNGDYTSSNYSLTVAGGQGVTFAYDLAGNLTNEVTTTSTNEYDWDAENQLVELTQWTNGERLSSLFSYDGFGRRVRIVEETNSVAGSTNQFVWSGIRLCEERDGNNDVTKRYYAEGMMDYYPSAGPYYYTFDHLGSIRELVDGTGAIRARYDYDPYGRRTKVQGDLDADFGFTRYYVHPPSGLQLALYRAYDADIGRFINRDPIEEAGGLNLYDYVENNPINRIDSLGLCGPCAAAGLAEVFGGGPEDPAADVVAALILAGYGVAALCQMSRGHGERGIQGKDPNPWKGYRPKDPNDPSKGGMKRDPQTGKWKPVPRPSGPPPKNHPNW